MTEMVRRAGFKTAALIILSFVVAGLLFLTIGSLERSNDTAGCHMLNNSGQSISCPIVKQQGMPLSYRDTGTSLQSQLSLYGLLVDLGVWLLIAGVVVFGAASMYPGNNKKE